jgi:hypothetical protein
MHPDANRNFKRQSECLLCGDSARNGVDRVGKDAERPVTEVLNDRAPESFVLFGQDIDVFGSRSEGTFLVGLHERGEALDVREHDRYQLSFRCHGLDATSGEHAP